MPYIPKVDRIQYELHIHAIVQLLTDGGQTDFNVGELNYVISKIIWELFDGKPSYKYGNALLGDLDAVSKEFYRRKLVPYEDLKIQDQGDL